MNCLPHFRGQRVCNRGGKNGQYGYFYRLSMYCVDKMDAVIRFG